MSIEIIDIGTYKMYYYTNDNDWQKPNITEYKIYKLFFQDKNIPMNYFAFPWAQMIDNLNIKNPAIKYADHKLINIVKDYRVENKNCFTIIQHIYFREYLEFIKNIGIKYIFTPHKQPSDDELEKKYNIKLISISLYPVQHCETKIKPINERKYLMSFIGTYSSTIYLTNIREQIYDKLSKYQDSCIIRRYGWHYENQVYKKQNANINNEIEYKNIMGETKFSLCPSGSGPNSFRIWESMSFGSIPVILSDTLILPEIKNINWNNFFILWKENDIDKLHDYLLKIKPNKLQILCDNCIKLYKIFFSPEKMTQYVIKILNKNKMSKKKIINVYKNFDNHDQLITKNITYYQGLGDFIRGTLTLYRICKEYDYELIIDLNNHPIGKYFVNSNLEHIELVKNEINNFYSFFYYDDLLEYIKKNNNKQIIILNTNAIYKFENIKEYDINYITDEEAIYLKKIFKFKDKYIKLFNDKLNKLPKKYNIFQIRVNDNLDKNEIDKINEIINIFKINFEKNDIVISNSSFIKKILVDKFNCNIIEGEITHVGLDKNTSHFNTLFEFFLVSKANKVKTFSNYWWISGFVFWPSLINRIELTKINNDI